MNDSFRYDEDEAIAPPSAPVPPSFWNELIDNPNNNDTAATLSFVLVSGSLIGIVACAVVTGVRRARAKGRAAIAGEGASLPIYKAAP